MQPPSAPRMPCPAMCPANAPAAPPLRQPTAWAGGLTSERLRLAAATMSAYRIGGSSLCHVLLEDHLILLGDQRQRLTTVSQRVVVGLDLGCAVLLRDFRINRSPDDRAGGRALGRLLVRPGKLGHHFVILHGLAGP